ncbi:hypothetical protein B0T11DRAFT_284043 [Plectosphaerella cucumerina]|uniref:Uncharacterized protein n=1 Tax=Plectosphaerella cucumerina TaxID=40658 RepID=A0A8K0TGP1_9PEZI|nr:hypothetical protein B0T11DRAFT_284043 [Plectosphaerella cucumerina]
METPSFTCLPPCQVKLPPWTGVTTTIDFPRVTVTDGAWKKTITRPPLVISKWMFEPVTLRAGGGAKRDVERRQQGFEDFWPVLATTPYWPAVTYIDGNGAVKTTTPDVPFPTPPPSIGPGAPAPEKGAWPKRAVHPVAGVDEQPLVEQCFFDNFGFSGQVCPNPWYLGTYHDDEKGESGGSDPGPLDDEEEAEELECPGEEETSTSSTSRPTTTAAPEPEPPKPMATPNPEMNVVDCFHKGRTEDHDRLSNAINSFCNHLHREKGDYILPMRFEPRPSPLAVGAGNWSPTDVYMRAIIKDGCDWHWSLAECTRYMLVTLDSCNCAGINAKQGGVLSNNCMVWMVDPNAGI